jgi:hypothetical protein
MTKKYKVTWTKGDGIEYTESFTSDALIIEQVPGQFIRQVAKSSNYKVLRVEELEEGG